MLKYAPLLQELLLLFIGNVYFTSFHGDQLLANTLELSLIDFPKITTSYFVQEDDVVVVEFPSFPKNWLAKNRTGSACNGQPARILMQDEFLNSGECWSFEPVMALNAKVLHEDWILTTE